MTKNRGNAHRRLDLAALLLLAVGLACGSISYLLIETTGLNALVLVPSVVAATTGASHLIKWEVPGQSSPTHSSRPGPR